MSIFITHVHSLFYKNGILFSALLFSLLFAFQQFFLDIFLCQYIQICLILLNGAIVFLTNM